MKSVRLMKILSKKRDCFNFLIVNFQSDEDSFCFCVNIRLQLKNITHFLNDLFFKKRLLHENLHVTVEFLKKKMSENVTKRKDIERMMKNFKT